MIDATAALRAYLLADPIVAGMTTRVYGLELPEIDMPVKAVVLQPSGGAPLPAGLARIFAQRFDVRCYAETPYQAIALMAVVHDALKQMVRAKVGTALLHSAESAGGWVSGRDPDTDWPFVFESFQVIYAEIPAGA